MKYPTQDHQNINESFNMVDVKHKYHSHNIMRYYFVTQQKAHKLLLVDLITVSTIDSISETETHLNEMSYSVYIHLDLGSQL